MKRILFFLLLVINLSAFGQVPSGYTKAGWRYKVKAFIFDSTLHIPSYNGTPSGIRTGGWVGDGAIGMDTTNHRMYIYSGGAWLRLAKYSEVATPTWQQTLTAGSTLTGNNTIYGGLNNIDFDDFNGFTISVRNNSGIEFNGYNGAKRSAISVAGDSIVLKLNNSGNFYIDSLQNVSTQSVLLGGTSSINNRKIGYLNIGTGLSLSSGTLNSVWTASGNDVYNNNSGNVGIGTSTPATKFHTVGTVRHQTLGTAITDTTTYKPLVINSSGDVLPSTYWYGGGGGGSPAGSNKQVQYNNSGSFGGATGVEIGNTNERLTVTSQSTSESAIVAKNEGGSGHVGISIENSNTNNPYSPLLTFTSNTTSNTRTSKIGIDYGKLMIEGSAEPYQTTEYSLVRFGNFYAGLGNVDIHNYLYATPSSPNNWTMKVRTPSTSSSGLAIEWGATGQTANLLELRNNSSTILSSFDKDGKLYLGSSSAPTTTLQVSGNMAANQGADVASANNLAVVANTTEITGTTQVNLIANTGWVNGAEINLLLANGITIKNGQTTSGSNITILLDGAADFVTASASMLTLVLSEVGGTQAWREKSRRSY